MPGETLAADALANAIAPGRSPPRPSPGRIAVAMSGGVDSAVALLRAAPNAIGVTLRLWLDPAGPSSERACCSPDAVIAARETCHRLGLPHVTLDLREEFRATVVQPFVDGLRAGPDAEPVHALQRALPVRRARRLRRARRRRRALDGPLRADRRAGRAAADRPRRATRPRISRTCSRRSTRRCSTASRSRSAARASAATRDEAAAAGLAVAERAESQEACFLAGDDYRTFLERQGLARRPGPIVDEDGVELGRHDGVWRYTPGQRRGIGLASPEPVYALRADAATNTLTVGPRSALEVREVERSRPPLPAGRAGRGEAPLPIRRRARARSRPTGDGFALRLERAGVRGRAGSGGRALRRRRDRRSRRHRRRNRVGSPR